MGKFYYGTATAAFQIEGAVAADGRGVSIWDTMCRRPGAIFTGENADVSCDSYHRWKEDIQWMKKLGVNAYRFSLSWPRIMKDGKSANPAGIAFYQRFCDALLENGIEPFVTLYHWDLPQELETCGGWTTRNTVDAFQRYAQVAVKALGAQVKHWMTFNEPWCSAVYGYYQGVQAPGRKESPQVVSQVVHNLLMAHGFGVRAVREFGAPNSEAGIVLNPCCGFPATQKPEDIEAFETFWRLENDWWLEPLYAGHYPDGGWRGLYDARPEIQSGDLELIAEPTDFLGVNLYSAIEISLDWIAPFGYRADYPTGRPSAGGMPLVPETVFDTLQKIYRHYPVKKFYIAENGAPGKDEVPDKDGIVHDSDRVTCLKLYMEQMEKAIAAGVPVEGYFVWTLMDNFEWIWGYSKPFGLLHVDFKRDCIRTPKDSFWFYHDWIAQKNIRQ